MTPFQTWYLPADKDANVVASGDHIHSASAFRAVGHVVGVHSGGSHGGRRCRGSRSRARASRGTTSDRSDQRKATSGGGCSQSWRSGDETPRSRLGRSGSSRGRDYGGLVVAVVLQNVCKGTKGQNQGRSATGRHCQGCEQLSKMLKAC